MKTKPTKKKAGTRGMRLWKKPEPSVPEDIKDLLWQGKKSFHHQPHELNKCHDENVNEAYRRGKAQK